MYAFVSLFALVKLHAQTTDTGCDTGHCISKDESEAQVLEVSLLQREMQVHKSEHAAKKMQVHKSKHAAKKKQDQVVTGMIDTHSHVVPELWKQYLDDVELWNDRIHVRVVPMDELLVEMNTGGVSAVVLSVSPEIAPAEFLSDPSMIANFSSQINAYLASDQVRGLTTPSRIGAFALLPMPDVDATLAEIKRSLAPEAYYGQVLDGVGLYTSYMLNGVAVRLDDPAFTPVWEELNKQKATVFIHPTMYPVNPTPEISYSTIEFPAETTRNLILMWRAGILDKYPDINIIAAHGGGFLAFDVSYIISHLTSGLDEATTNSSLRSIYIDTSKVKADPADGALGAMESFVGHSQMLFGSDFPYAGGTDLEGFDIQPGVQRYIKDHWTADQVSALSHGNALKLFPRFQAAVDADVLASKKDTPLLQMNAK
jgi:aminocarboxymuconate-semialdehyde decarboxylase